jgi:hypothetical protein
VAQSCRAGYLFASQQGPLLEEGEKQLQLEMDLLGKYGKATGTYGFSSNAVDRYSVTGYGTWMDAPGAPAEDLGITGAVDARDLEALTVQGRLDLGDEAYTVCSQPVHYHLGAVCAVPCGCLRSVI